MKKINNRVYKATALVALLIILWVTHFQILPESIADPRKRVKIETLYMRYQKEFPEAQEVTPRTAIELTNTGKVVFIDVREPEEQSVSRLPGAITVDFYLENQQRYSDYIKIAYCTIGYRSGIFAQELGQSGVPVYNLRGGVLAWVYDGGRVYNETGETKRIHVYGEKWNLGPENFEAVW
jgi:sodium/bile acid cotransporter 7